MKIAFFNETLHSYAGPGHWNDADMLIAGMDGLSETQNRSFFSLWCLMAAPLMAGNDLRKMTKSTVDVLTNLEAIGVNQDPLGIQGRIVRRNGEVSIWAGKKLFDGSQAVLVFSQGKAPAEVRLDWPEIGMEAGAKSYVRDLWKHAATGPHAGGMTVAVAPNDVAFLRVSETEAFPIPPIIVADSYRVALRGDDTGPRTLAGTITVRNRGTGELPLWKVRGGLPSWLSVKVAKNGPVQVFTCVASTAGLKKGFYHTIVRADNVEPVSGKPLSALYFDVDLEVAADR